MYKQTFQFLFCVVLKLILSIVNSTNGPFTDNYTGMCMYI